MWLNNMSLISQMSVLYNYVNIFSLGLFFFTIAISMIVNSFITNLRFLYFTSFFFWTFLLLVLTVCIFSFYKFYVSYNFFILSYYNYFNINNLPINNLFGDTLNCLCLLTTIISWVYLSERYLFKSNVNVFYFYIFICCTFQMTSTNDLFVMFIYFELLFLPSLFFVYHLGYSKKVDVTVSFLLKWTLSGSFLCLLGFCYFFFINGSFLIDSNDFIKLSFSEKFSLLWIFFLGFGVKLPIWPFYYWLTKVHVEAPTGFSIFLSGFLVKTAFFCFSYLFLLFNTELSTSIMISFCIWGILDASIRMWTSTDIKRLIAFATIQEMNLIVLLLFILDANSYGILNCFLLVHGVLSSFFFYLVDQVQKQNYTRNSTLLSGLSVILPTLTFLIWWAVLIFRGFPTFIKFLIEWDLLLSFIASFKLLGFFCFFFICFFSVLGFCRVWFIVLYGAPKTVLLHKIMLLKDFIFGFALGFILFFLNFILFLF